MRLLNGKVLPGYMLAGRAHACACMCSAHIKGRKRYEDMHPSSIAIERRESYGAHKLDRCDCDGYSDRRQYETHWTD